MDASRSYEDLVVRRELWVACLGNDDRHGIQQQLLSGVMECAVFRMSIKMRNLAPAAGTGGGIQLNGLFFQMLDHSFIQAQTAAVRRLSDRSYPIAHAGKGRDKSVYSLSALLVDMRDWAPQMTRENLMRLAGQPDVHPQWPELHLSHTIDWLCGTTESSRTDDDVVSPVLFDFLLNKIAIACADITKWATAYVAHAASPASRPEEGQLSVSWLAIWSAYEALASVAHLIRVWVLGGAHVVIMPTMQSDVAQWLDRPLVGSEDLQAVRDVWATSVADTERWLQDSKSVRDELAAFLQSA